MMRALLIALTLTASFGAVAQERQALLCVEEAASGLSFKDGSYKPVRFTPGRFSAIWDKDGKVLTAKGKDGEGRFECSRVLGDQTLYQCTDGAGYMIMLDLPSFRFSRSTLVGHIRSRTDNLTVSYGTCQKF